MFKQTALFRQMVVLVLLLTACSSTEATATQVVSLRGLADQQKVEVGAAVSIPTLRDDEQYRELLKREFNLVVAENAMKWDATEPAQGQFNFTDGDALVDFARENKMRVRGHTLVWHNQLPDWVNQGTWTKETLSEVLRQHVTAVVSHYKGEVYAWDVVNEAISDSGGMRTSIWSTVIGPEYIEIAFRAAHEADPDALLFYNEYGAEVPGRKATAVFELVKDLKDRGVPIHGVGMQMHKQVSDVIAQERLQTNIHRLTELGLVVHITEMDVRMPDDSTSVQTDQQVKIYGSVMRACLAEPGCDALLVWGVTDKYSWIPNFFQGTGSALLFDEAYQPKPAYQEWLKALEEME